ncbi:MULTISPECIES: hypothetical protein [unclassified Streptomyces]|uniref:hypothetical protein n=1 Tax=unclassified Streptomyces TaxID=2593676 RepID=UPI00131AD85D|nr:hypothetical protein [Streptomyces sp. CB01635]
MQDMTSDPERASWRKGVVVTVALIVALLAGFGVWKFWLSDDPLVAVPDRVCSRSLPGDSLRPLLPERGEAFEEYASDFSPRGSLSAPGKCVLSGGGKSVHIGYYVVFWPDGYRKEDVDRDAKKPGNLPVTLGKAKGYVEGRAVKLFVNCPRVNGHDGLLQVTASLGGESGKLKDRPTMGRVAALAADSARALGQRVEGCDSATRLPDGVPSIG